MSELLFENALVLDPCAGEIVGERSVLVREGRIEEVTEGRVTAHGARRVDLDGRVLMPGLCDAHVHVTAGTPDFAALATWSPTYTGIRAAEIMHGMLMRGFTTVRDAGGADFGLARAVEEGRVAGPRLLYAGKALSQTGGHGDMRGPGQNVFDHCYCCAGLGRLCDGVAEVRRACRDEIRKGARQIKLMVAGGVASPTDRIDSTQFSEEEIAAAVEEAQAANLYVMVHAYTPRAINRALRRGARSVEHGNLLDASSVELFLAHDAYLVPTLATYHAIAEEGIEAGFPADLQPKVYEVLDAGMRGLEMAHNAGVKTVYGTDLLGSMHQRQLTEFAIRAEVMSPADVIRSATSVAAELFGLSGEIGTVSPGASADLLVVDGNPLEDLGSLQDPDRHLHAIVKGGVLHKDAL
jgi:imidazolonepropionase-like amidohydrolase